MNTTMPRPLVPEDLPADKLLIRAITARAVAAARGKGARAEQIARAWWPRDAGTMAMVERAAVAGGTTTTAGWASELAGRSVGAFLGSLQTSAAAQLIAVSQQVSLPNYGSITLPRASTTGTPSWTGEGLPIAVNQAVIAGPLLGPPKKLALIETFTRELAQVTADSAEGIIGTVLRDAVARALDTSIFSATAADATRPAGILTGISATTAATGTAGAYAALTDLRALTDAVVTAGGSGDVRFVCSPGRAMAVETYAPTLVGKVFGSAAIGTGVLICVDVNSFTSMFGAEPEVDVSIEALIHMESAPLQIATGAQGSGVVSYPTQSLFQSDLVAIRILLDAAWALRVPGAVAHISTGLIW